MREVHSEAMESHLENNLDNIVIIRKVPISNGSTYTKEWIVERLFELLLKHKAIVLSAERDVKIMPDKDEPDKFITICLVIDGFSHMREMDHE